ncbi:MAG: sigW 1, partial [Verrucomicrobiales bacterium]|nr:sigW 1 [Verrucomicrobiales bacterium]
MDESHIRQLLSAQQWREGFEGIVVLYQEKVFHLALSMTRNSATASDMTQDVLLRVWKALPLYNGTASLSTWIYTIARNVCLTELTRAKRRAACSLDNPEMVDSILKVAAPEKNSFGIEADLETLLQQLSDREQRVLRLFYLE